MKHARYRSFPNYMDTMVSEHSAKYEWHRALELARKQSVMATQRGIGPAKQCHELPIDQVHGLNLGYEPLHEDGPICPGIWATLCCFHILRGAESACALAINLDVNSEKAEEQWRLPISKSDPTASGCIRKWGCICGGNADLACPFHAAQSLMRELHNRFGLEGRLPPELPLFPTAQGGWCTRTGFVATVDSIAQKLGLPLTDEHGRRAYGEHVWRVTGARHLLSMEIPVATIMRVARWGSAVVLRYLGDAPLLALTETYIRNRRSLCLRAAAAVDSENDGSVLEEATSALLCDDDAESNLNYSFVQHTATKRIHVAETDQLEFLSHHPLLTLCKWPANLANVMICDTLPSDGKLCKDCEKAALKLGFVIQ